MIQKKKGGLFVLLFGAMIFSAFSQTAVSLGEAIRTAAAEIGGSLPTGTSIAVADFWSTSARMSDYAKEEIISALTNQRNLVVVGRDADLDVIRRELVYQLSGEVSDASARSIGQQLGAQMVVTGSLRIAGSVYRFNVRVLDVETGVISYNRSQDVLNDSLVATLMGEEALVTNFTPGERVGAAVLNLALGLGSFTIQKDGMGGGVTAALEAIGAAAVIISFFQVKERWVTNPYTNQQEIERDTSVSTPVLIGGLSAYAAGAVFGVFRALSYRKPGVNVAEARVPWNIAMVPDNNGTAAVRLSYTLRF